jgi:hypothetical protein
MPLPTAAENRRLQRSHRYNPIPATCEPQAVIGDWLTQVGVDGGEEERSRHLDQGCDTCNSATSRGPAPVEAPGGGHTPGPGWTADTRHQIGDEHRPLRGVRNYIYDQAELYWRMLEMSSSGGASIIVDWDETHTELRRAVSACDVVVSISYRLAVEMVGHARRWYARWELRG